MGWTPVLTGLQPYKTMSKAAAVSFREHGSETTSIAPGSETDCSLLHQLTSRNRYQYYEGSLRYVDQAVMVLSKL